MHHADCHGCMWRIHQHHHLSDEGWAQPLVVACGSLLWLSVFGGISLCYLMQCLGLAMFSGVAGSAWWPWEIQLWVLVRITKQELFNPDGPCQCLDAWMALEWLCLVILKRCHAPRRLPRLHVENTPTSPSFGWRLSSTTCGSLW